jgi:hypothetical protein
MAEDCKYDEDGHVVGWEEAGTDNEAEEELLRDEEFDLYGTLKLARGNWEISKIESQSRAAYHRLALKWHPSNFKSRPVICDMCSSRLHVGPDCNWFHLVGDVYDVCSECYLEVADQDKKGYVMVSSEDDLGEEKDTYLPELEKQRKRDDAVKMFKRVALSYRVLGKDHELRQIYDTLGWQGLVKADVYAQVSIFSINAFTQYDDFFSGVDEEDRQYLLLNGDCRLPAAPTRSIFCAFGVQKCERYPAAIAPVEMSAGWLAPMRCSSAWILFPPAGIPCERLLLDSILPRDIVLIALSAWS